VQTGDHCPDVRLQPLDGGPALRPSDLRGKYVLYDFWATWCGPCVKASAAVLKPFYSEHGDDPRFEIVGVGNAGGDSPDRQSAVAAREGFGWTKVFDAGNELARAMSVSVLPTFVLVDPDGIVTRIAIGGNALPELCEQVAALLDAPAQA
jgi:thiol-disulfide isomerase/thioredoxin